MKFLCDSGERVSLCEPVQRLMRAKKQYDLVMESEERKDLSERLEKSYDSEVDPYLRDLCYVETPPTYMITVCEVLSILNEAKQKLHDEHNQRVTSPATHRLKMVLIEGAEHRVRRAQKNYEVMKEIAMEIICDRKEGPEDFCDLLEEFKIFEGENLYRVEEELGYATIALKSQVDVMCEIEKDKKHSRLHRFYLKTLCGLHLHLHVPSSL